MALPRPRHRFPADHPVHRVDVGVDRTRCGSALSGPIEGMPATGADFSPSAPPIYWTTDRRTVTCPGCGARPRARSASALEGSQRLLGALAPAAPVLAALVVLLVPGAVYAAEGAAGEGLSGSGLVAFALGLSVPVAAARAARRARLSLAGWVVALAPRAQRVRAWALGQLKARAVEVLAEQAGGPTPRPRDYPIDPDQTHVPDPGPASEPPATEPPATLPAPVPAADASGDRDAQLPPLPDEETVRAAAAIRNTREAVREMAKAVIPGTVRVCLGWIGARVEEHFEPVVVTDIVVADAAWNDPWHAGRPVTREEWMRLAEAGAPILPYDEAERFRACVQLVTCHGVLARNVGETAHYAGRGVA